MNLPQGPEIKRTHAFGLAVRLKKIKEEEK